MSKPTIREVYAHPSAMEPLFPSFGAEDLREMAASLLQKSARLGSALHPVTRRSVAALLRTMNSYYSNLIEGHNTHPLAIERALRHDYSSDPALRALQLESLAHIEVQALIEQRLEEDYEIDICSSDFLCWIHRVFYQRLPDEFRVVKTASGSESRVSPGELRDCEVEVGRHIPPGSFSLPGFLSRFSEGYSPAALDPLQRIAAAAASHHRLAWIHPFLDGNGRVTRLFTHAYFIRANTGGQCLWSISRGLARRRDEYMAALAGADAQRRNDLDGRGNLSDERLAGFCRFFLSAAIDQVDFMGSLLDLDSIQERILFFADRWMPRAQSSSTIPHLLRDIFLRGEVSRGECARILQKPERTARRTIGALLEKGLLVSEAPGAPVRIGFPARVVSYYFPRLYPEGVEYETARGEI